MAVVAGQPGGHRSPPTDFIGTSRIASVVCRDVVWLFALLVAQQTDPVLLTVARGEFSEVSQVREVFVRERSEWEALWRSHAPADPAPAVDFSTDAIAAVFLGTRPTGGFGVEITSARRQADTLIIAYVERRPDPADIVTQVLTSPFHIVELPRHAGPVRFQKEPVAGAR